MVLAIQVVLATSSHITADLTAAEVAILIVTKYES